MNEDKKTRIAVWLRPSTITKMDAWLKEENCKSRSEFIEKALRFYIGYLTSNDMSLYLSQALVTTIQGTVAEEGRRIRSMLFKLCVELNMALHMMAAHFGVEPVDVKSLRAFAVDEVKRTNGQIGLDRALKVQRETGDDEWLA